MRRCEHKWKIVNRSFTPPVGLSHSRGFHIDQLKDLLVGFTTIEERCELCGKTDFNQILGDQSREPS